MKNTWKIKKLGEVYDVRDGTHDSPKYLASGFPLVTSKNLKNSNLILDNVSYISELDYININKRSKVDKGDILFAMIGTIGNPVVVQEKPNFAIKNVALFKVPKEQNSYFLKYYLDTKLVVDKMIVDAKGTTQKFVGLGYLRDFEIPLPPLSEQQRIVYILDEAFASISKAKYNAEQNLKNARELFESYLQNVFANKGDDWEEKMLSELYHVGSSRRVLKSQWKTEGVPFYRGREITKIAHEGFVDNNLFISEEHYLKLSKLTGVPTVNDIVITAIGTIGNAYIVKNTDRFYFKDASVLWMKKKSETSSEFIRFWLKSSLFFNQLDRGNGATVDTLTIQKLQRAWLYLPTIKEQKEIVKKLEALSSETKKLEAIYKQKLNDLEELKKSILQKAFNGEL